MKTRGVGTALIYKGKPVPPGELRSVVAITIGDRRAVCSGTLIEPDIVLTAGHCVCEGARGNVFVGNSTWDPDKRPDDKFYLVKRWRSAIGCGSTLRTGLDLGLLAIDEDVAKVSAAEAVKLATIAQIDQTQHFRVVGFGATDEQGKKESAVKLQADVPSVSNGCDAAVANDLGCLAGTEIVAGRQSTPDSCKGDSGGPIFVASSGDTRGVPHELLLLAGVTSRPVRGSRTPCGQGGIYERLTPSARSWIQSQILDLRRTKNQSERGGADCNQPGWRGACQVPNA